MFTFLHQEHLSWLGQPGKGPPPFDRRGCTGVGSGGTVKFYLVCCILNSGFGIWFTIAEPPGRPGRGHFGGPPVRIFGVFSVRHYSFPSRKFISISFVCMFLLAVTSPGSLYYYFCNVAMLQPVIYELRTLVRTKVVLRRAL